MVVSVTLSLILYAFVRQSERLSKKDCLILLVSCLKGDSFVYMVA